jgi:endonuclease-3
MSTVSRTAQFGKLHKVLKKHYKPVPMNAGRTVMEHLLFACCLEGARYEAAEESFAALVHTFFDLNEVRVTSISELSEVLACLPDPRSAANRIKRVLHAVFEARFNFDLEDTKKKNLGPTIKWLEDLDGTTRFTVAFTVQASLGGHSIPLDAGSMAIVKLLDLVSEKDAEKGEVPGLERAIPKSKGVEFGSLLHQFAADFSANPYSPAMKGILLEVDPGVAARLPKRRAEPSAKKIAEAKAEEAAEAAKPQSGEPKKGAKKEESKPEAGAKAGTKKKTPAAEKPAEPSKKPNTKSSPEAAAKPAAEKPAPRETAPAKKKSVAEGLSKRKPR